MTTEYQSDCSDFLTIYGVRLDTSKDASVLTFELGMLFSFQRPTPKFSVLRRRTTLRCPPAEDGRVYSDSTRRQGRCFRIFAEVGSPTTNPSPPPRRPLGSPGRPRQGSGIMPDFFPLARAKSRKSERDATTGPAARYTIKIRWLHGHGPAGHEREVGSSLARWRPKRSAIRCSTQ